MDAEADRYRRTIWLWDGASAKPFTQGPGDSSPRWSPDGTRLAFLRKGPEKGDPTQVAIIAAGGGEARVVTSFDLSVEGIEWSPDGNRLVAVVATWIDEWVGLSDEERERKPRRIDRVPFRFDNKGWIHDRRRHLYLVDPDGGEESRLLTQGDSEDTAPVWRPDGTTVAFLGNHHEGNGFEPGVTVEEVDVESGDRRVVVERGSWLHVTYRPDGVMHVVGQPDPWSHPTISSVWRVGDDGELTDLTGHLDRSTMVLSPAVSPSGPQWIGDSFLTCLEDAGRVRVIRVDPDGSVDPVIWGDRAITGVSPNKDGSTFAFIATETTDPGELCLWSDGEERVLTDINGSFRRDAGLIAPEHFRASSDGVDIDTWVYLPEGDGPVPVLLNIHGGPAAQYGFGFFDEFQMYAGAGYAVVACNPRGSSGRGVEFVKAVTGDGWGVVDSADVTAALEDALARFDRLDADRIGIMGGSYGGFLSAWMIARDHRYKSAVVERGLLSWVSFAGTSDIGSTFGRYYLSLDLPAGVDRFWEASPIATADQVTTPTLIIQSEKDFRCPIEQAEQLFMILLRAGVEAEFVRFPGEGHELSRSGTPKHRSERFEFILDWHAHHLDVAD